MLRITNISKSYNNLLFSNISFQLGNNEKVGLVGLNGSGKTTLFKIIAGLESYDSGSIQHDQSIGYLPQEFDLDLNLLVGEYLESVRDELLVEPYQIDRILGKLSLLNEIDEYQYLYQLSDGQRMKLYLAKLILKDENTPGKILKPMLLLDEPTNHLDINGILWFEQFIKKYEGGCMIISHDRDFLNSCVSKIYEIDEQKLNVFHGNYDDYIVGKERWLETREKEFVLQEKRRKKLEELLEHVSKIGDGKARSRAMSSARKRMEREVTSSEISRYKKVSVSGLNLSGAIHAKKKMLEVSGMGFSYDKRLPIIKDATLTLWGKEKVWIYGANGSGKTTFIKILMGLLTPDEGSVKWGENVSYDYFSQDQSHMDMNAKVADYFMKRSGVNYYRSFGVLDKFLFDKSFRNHKVGDLSPGQRARLSFAIFAQGNNNFLILDEPTNHLDIQTKEIIENALREFQGNIILISHDRYFVKQVEPDRGFTIEDGRVIEVGE